ncbi:MULTISPECIES: hypothetical protein [Psychrobacter]|uniref:Uncharacterized protein n=1 Tax=Psychrobacter alimentarius TaxID=261164 RepID=A0ABM6A1G1_9GAMM|nr:MULTISPECIES: hypothetical protein [Psychrobacter]AMT98183.1 hypothetical protein A3K91_2612 [Psychrobacter alimentarius]QCB29553.1 hypothetical protein E5677_00340 [Psychrobacter sp. PAMC27889]
MPINVDVTPDMRQRALDFAQAIILGNNQFDRLLPADIRTENNLETSMAIRIQRTYVGKLGELVFAQVLLDRGGNVDFEPMFEIFEGQNNVDGFDFETNNNQTVDIKTGFRANHRLLMVNEQQLRQPKDYYVGIKLNAIDPDLSENIINLETIDTATVYGYITHNDLVNANPRKNFGEGYASWLRYTDLRDINELLNQF